MTIAGTDIRITAWSLLPLASDKYNEIFIFVKVTLKPEAILEINDDAHVDRNQDQ